ncbi:MAG: hypothetical protein KGL39_34110 [Patescibacteria group bacterium]|nr:hypothetical protein [Patescibacteria group bacterium]
MIANLTDLCAAVAPVYEALGYAPPTAMDVLDLVVQEQQERAARLNRVLGATENGRHERKFLRDEHGQAFGEHTLDIPEDLVMHLIKDKRFGREAIETPEGRKEIARCFPGCRTVQAHSDRKYIGRGMDFGGKRAGVRFMPGTIQLAR